MLRPISLLTLGACLAGACSASPAFAQGKDVLQLDPKGAVTARLGYFPVPIALSDDKPASVKKEPAYRSKPKYGTFHLGDGPKSTYVLAVDEPEGADWKIYIDKNRNGDLTDDGDGSWNKKNENNGRVMYGVMDVEFRASYGTAKKEASSSPYSLGLYRFVGRDVIFSYRQSARVGTVTLDGKTHKALLVENDADGLFDKPVASKDEAGKTRPVWLQIDLNDDGKYASGMIDIRAPFKLGEGTYEATVSADGSQLRVAPTQKEAIDLAPPAPKTKPLLAAGSPAPDFTAQKWGGGDLKLSDYRGKVVILDFWATWCGPCQQSMPHIETVHKAVQGQDVVVIGVCVWDEKAAYDDWVPKNSSKYTFQFAFDPAGRGNDGIASKLFNVSGIPTTYIIDKDGNVADAIVGYEEGDKRVEEALKKLGVKLD